MGRVLIVDDDEPMRRLIRLNLEAVHEVLDTGAPELALALALEHKPDAILLDLRMPKYSGFELCRTFTSFGATQLIPIFVISGEGGTKTKDFCRELGAVAFFEKPVDFDLLRLSLSESLKNRRQERRGEVRVRLPVPLRLSGVDAAGTAFQALTTTENVARNSLLCATAAVLANGSVVQVRMLGPSEELFAEAKVIRKENGETSYPKYALRFVAPPVSWVLQ
jgi:DNA-binding response OmpR family regulator